MPKTVLIALLSAVATAAHATAPFLTAAELSSSHLSPKEKRAVTRALRGKSFYYCRATTDSKIRLNFYLQDDGILAVLKTDPYYEDSIQVAVNRQSPELFAKKFTGYGQVSFGAYDRPSSMRVKFDEKLYMQGILTYLSTGPKPHGFHTFSCLPGSEL